MKPNFFLVLMLVLSSTFCFSQKYFSKSSEVSFEASVPLFEDVYAKQNTVSVLYDVSKNEMAILGIVKNFKFKIPLMEEHFNENYAESNKYPKTTFLGKINNVMSSDLQKGYSKNIIIEGVLGFHGVSKKVTIPAVLSVNNDNLLITGSFTSKPEDFNIKIPKLVTKKIAENVKVNFNLTLEKMNN